MQHTTNPVRSVAQIDAIVAANIGCSARTVQDIRLGKTGERKTDLKKRVIAELKRIEDENKRFMQRVRG